MMPPFMGDIRVKIKAIIKRPPMPSNKVNIITSINRYHLTLKSKEVKFNRSLLTISKRLRVPTTRSVDKHRSMVDPEKSTTEKNSMKLISTIEITSAQIISP